MQDNDMALPDDAPQPRLCHIVKWSNFDGYGFNLHADKSKPGQYIGKVDSNSPAETAGLKELDRIIEVNEVNISNENHKQVVQRIKSQENETKLLVVDMDTDIWYKEHNMVVKSNQPNVIFGTSKSKDPAIEEEKECETKSQISTNGDSVKEDKPTNSVHEDTHSNSVHEDSHSSPVPEDSHCKPVPEDSHSNSVHEDSHSNSVHEDSHTNSVHEDTHTNSVHEDSHSNSVHEDSHSNSVHEDSHSNSVHEDNHSNSVHEDNHTKSFHEDAHSIASRSSSQSDNTNKVSTPDTTTPSPPESVDQNNENGKVEENNVAPPKPPVKGQLNLDMTAAEMRAQLSMRKKADPRNENIDLKKKYQIIQNM